MSSPNPDAAVPVKKQPDFGVPKRRRRWPYVAGVCLVLLLIGGGKWYHWIVTGRFLVVHKGHLYRSALMSPERLRETCAEYGIRTVIDFRTQEDRAEAEEEALEGSGVRHVHIPSNQVPPEEAVEEFLGIMDDPSNHPVLIHCTHGVGRTGVFTAIYRMEYQGWSNARARREALIMAGFESFRKDTSKGEFLRNYTPRKAGPNE